MPVEFKSGIAFHAACAVYNPERKYYGLYKPMENLLHNRFVKCVKLLY